MTDSEDVFPDLELSPLKKLDETIEADEVVWAKWKGVFWPALVRKCNKKQKKAVIVYTDSPCNDEGKEMRHNKSYRQLVRFDNSPESKQLMEGGSNGEDDELQAAIQLAKDYIIKRATGNLYVSALEFFLDPKCNILANPNATNGVKRKLEDNSKKPDKKLPKISPDSEVKESTNEKNCPETSDTSLTEKEEELDDKTKPIIDKIGAKIKSIVEGEECKAYLVRVAQNKVTSYRHNYFSYGTLSQRKNLKLLSFEKILNENQLNDIITNLKVELEGKVKVKRNNVLNYILDVMVPEALMFGMQKVLNITKKKADHVLRGERISELEYDKLIKKFGDSVDVVADTTQCKG